jgi:peptidoglycan/LPS O-acetylase OafA/YrhL
VVIVQRISTERQIDLQVLRGVAVVCVVLFHTKPQLFPNGYLGVDVFFVISGYVLAPKILDIFANDKSAIVGIQHFVQSRYRRLMPALLFMILIVTILIFLLAPVDDHFKFYMQSCAALLGVANFSAVNFSGNYFNPNPNPLLHTWSLSAEEQIYVLVPLLFFFISKRTILTTRKIQIILSVIILVSMLFYFETPGWISNKLEGFIPIYRELNYYSPFSRLWQFAVGIALFTLLSNSKPAKSRAKSVLGNSLLLVLLLLMIFRVVIGTRLLGFIVVAITLLIIFFGAYNNRLRFPYLYFSWVGNRSYSIYLFHLPLIYLAKFSPVFGSQSQPKRILLIYALVLTFILSEISYRFVERILQIKRNDTVNYDQKLKTRGIFLISFTLLISLFAAFSSYNNYWGINSSIPRPAVAWELNSDCPPMSKRALPCFYGDTGKPETLLIGDSQAAQISQVYIESAKEMGFNPGVWTLATCEFILLSSEVSRLDTECLKHNNEVLSWILDNKPKLVTVAQYIKPKSSYNELADAISQLTQAGIRTVLIENIPIFPDETLYMKNTTQLQLMLGKSYIPPKSFLRSEMLLDFESASSAVSKLVRSNGAETIKITDLFCNVFECRRFAANQWLYWDNHHLSVHGAELIKNRLMKTFELTEFSPQ